MPLSEVVLIVVSLLTVAVVAAGLFRRLPIPFTVMLVVIGLVLREASRHWPALSVFAHFELSADIVFFMFLPVLIFESGLSLEARQLLKDLAPILMLAILALLISTAIVGIGLRYALGMELIVALLFGALISATDPVAVIALFKELGAPLRLTVLVEGESLLNDATAIVLFSILLAIAVGGSEPGVMGVGGAIVDFLRVFVGGAVVGALMGLVAAELLIRLKSDVSSVLALSIALAYASFIVSEHTLHVSGVMASAAAAVVFAATGVTRMPQGFDTALAETWELLALVCNSLLFLLVGLSVELALIANHIGPIALAVVLVLVARGLSIWSLVPMSTSLFKLTRVGGGERFIMWWGGLKGGLAIAIVLSIPETLPARDLLLTMTLGVVLFTMLVNAPTIRPLMSRFRLDELNADERVELETARGAAGSEGQRILDELVPVTHMSRSSTQRIERDIDSLFRRSRETGVSAEQRARHALSVALGIELDRAARLRAIGLVSQFGYLDIFMRVRRQKERDRDTPVDGEEDDTWFTRLENALLRRLRESDFAARILSAYQNVRLSGRLRQDLAGALIAGDVIERTTDHPDLDEEQRAQVLAIYEARMQHHRERLEELRRDFPEFYERFITRLTERVALQGASELMSRRRQDGDLGAKAYSRIERIIQGEIELLPPLSEALPRPDTATLLALVPWLAGLSGASLNSLAERAKPVTVLADDIIIGESERGDALYIVTRGDLEATRQDPEAEGGVRVLGRLGDGDFFGETALLGDHVRTATVTARSTSTLLRLTRRDVLALAERNPELSDRLEEAKSSRETSD